MTSAARHLLTIAVAAAACLGQPAHAKEPSPAEVQRIRAAFTDCAVKRSAPVARALVLENAYGGRIWSEGKRLIDGFCLRDAANTPFVRMSFPGELFLYSIAEALIRADYAAPRAFDFATQPPLTQREPYPMDPELVGKTTARARAAEAGYKRALAFYLISKWGECVVRRDPAKAHGLLVTPVASPEESAAMSAMSSTFGACLGKGQIKMNKQVVRGTLAVNFYRLAGPPAGAAIKAPKVS